MTNKDYMNQVMYLLKQSGIRQAGDLDRQYPDNTIITATNIFDEGGKGWITDLYDITKEHFDACSQIMNDEKTGRTYFVSDNTNMETLKYMCIFPSSLILSDSFSTGTSMGVISTNYVIQKSYIKNLLAYRRYIENDIFTLLPRSFILNMSYSAGQSITTLGGCYLPGQMADYLGTNGVFIENTDVNNLFLTFPWLYGASTDDYLNIVTKYSSQYKNYRLLIYEFLASCKNGNPNFQKIYKDIEKAHENMQIQFELAKNQLYAKGIQAIVGLAFTFIPLLTDLPPEIKASLQTVLGMTSLKDARSVIFDQRQTLKNLGKTDPCYISWQWEKKSLIKEKNKKT